MIRGVVSFIPAILGEYGGTVAERRERMQSMAENDGYLLEHRAGIMAAIIDPRDKAMGSGRSREATDQDGRTISVPTRCSTTAFACPGRFGIGRQGAHRRRRQHVQP